MNGNPGVQAGASIRQQADGTDTSAADLRAPEVTARAVADGCPDGHSIRLLPRRLVLALAVVAAIIVVAVMALGGAQPSASRPSAASPRLIPDAHAQFPYETASDVVSYADHVAVVTAVSQRVAPPSAVPEGGAPSDTVSRLVTFRVNDILWSRHGAPTLPATFSAPWWGWLKQGHQPFVVDGTPWVFTGGHYVVPIAFDGTRYSIIQPFAVFRFEGGTVTPEEQSTELARSLAGAARADVAKMFRNAAPDPLAVRYADLLPRDRLNAVIAARKASR